MSVPIRIDDSSNIFHRFAHGDKDKTAICTGIQASGHGMQRFSADFTGSILLFSLNDDHSSVVMRRIPVDRLFSQHKRLYIVIDEYFQGKSMQEYLNDAHSDSPRREFSEFSYMMGMIINTYSHLLPLPINPQHILHSSGKLLILPEKWSHIITSYESEQSRQKGLARINYPDQHGFDKKKLQTFCFACSLYYMLSQHWSIEEDDNSIHDRLKRMKVHRPIEALLPEIPEELAAWFHEALRLKISDCSVPIFYLKKPQSLQSADRSPENTDRRIRSWQRSLKREKLRNTIRRHILPISIAAAVLIIFLASMAAIIRQATSDLLITGLAPEEVIRTFYESYNNLDHTFMADATYRKAGREKVNQITSLYAITAIREGTERRQIFMSASEWLEKFEAEQELLTQYMIFGISDLDIRPFPDIQGDDAHIQGDAHFVVSYSLWTPEDTVLKEEHIQEHVTMRKFRRGWKIVSITE